MKVKMLFYNKKLLIKYYKKHKIIFIQKLSLKTIYFYLTTSWNFLSAIERTKDGNPDN